jgi:hypothetical protein
VPVNSYTKVWWSGKAVWGSARSSEVIRELEER